MLENTHKTFEIVDTSKIPNEDELNNLGEGCYVQVKDGDNCYWVEIQSADGEYFTGVVHCELGGSVCRTDLNNLSETTFHKKQIINLGCDNYCWC